MYLHLPSKVFSLDTKINRNLFCIVLAYACLYHAAKNQKRMIIKTFFEEVGKLQKVMSAKDVEIGENGNTGNELDELSSSFFAFPCSFPRKELLH